MTQKKMFSVRLPEETIEELEDIAQSRYMPTRTLVRSWIMQRLDAERMNIEPAPGVELGRDAPGAGAQHTSEGVVVDEDTGNRFY